MFKNGCKKLKIDFHLHTRADKEFIYSGNEDYYNSDYVSALKEKQIDIGIITNHNKFNFEEYRALSKTASKKGILLLPGVELSVKEGSNGIHTLLVFNPEEWLKNGTDYINRFLTSAFANIPHPENQNTRCKYDLFGAIQELENMDKDYFIVFAHAEQKCGIINECDGGMITTLFSKSDVRNRVLGMQKVRTRDNISKLNQWLKYDIPFVEGSDPKSIDEIGKDDNVTYLKIGEMSFNSVKYALQDFKNRGFKTIENHQHGYIKSASFKGGKLDGLTINFSNELNTLIGIRGSGKSSILEVIRYALGLTLTSIDKQYKDDLVKNILGSGGQVSLKVIDQYGQEYEVRQILNETASVLDADGRDLPISIKTLINNPLYFGQKDLSFTEDGYEFKLLEKLVGNKINEQTEKIAEYNNQLEDLIRQLITFDKIPAQIEEIRNKNEDIKHKLQIYEEKGIAEKLKKQTSCNTDVSNLKNIVTAIESIISELSAVNISSEISKIDICKYISEYNPEIYSEASKITNDIIVILNNIQREISDLATQKKDLDSIVKKLDDKVSSLKEEFAEIKREIKDDTLDPDSYVKYNNDFEKNNNIIKQLEAQAKSRIEIITSIKKAIRERNETLQSIFSAYQQEINSINENQSELKIEIEFKGNKAQFKEDLKTFFKGTSISDSKYQRICDDFSDFVAVLEDYYLNESEKLHDILADGEYAKLSEKIDSNYQDLIKKECPNLVKILYHGKSLEKHSIGQRASALILFILTQQDNDIIIIDQPEDDLDNQIIYKEVIHTIKEKKPYIQFIFATHNANIPVLGDAEKIIVTSYQDDSMFIDEGNIDCPHTHTKIVDIMEGGREAFEKRNLIYTAWK